MSRRGKTKATPVRSCACCGCTDITPCVCLDSQPCHWVEPDLCSGCVEGGPQLAYELRAGGYHELAERVIAAHMATAPLVELATEGEMNAILRARRAGQ